MIFKAFWTCFLMVSIKMTFYYFFMLKNCEKTCEKNPKIMFFFLHFWVEIWGYFFVTCSRETFLNRCSEMTLSLTYQNFLGCENRRARLSSSRSKNDQESADHEFTQHRSLYGRGQSRHPPLSSTSGCGLIITFLRCRTPGGRK